MKKTFSVFVISLLGLLLCWNPAFAGDEDSGWLKSDISAGYHAVGHDDEKSRAAEYDEAESSAYMKLDMMSIKGSTAFSLDGSYFGSDESEFTLKLDVNRYLKLDVTHDRMHHRLDHDTLFRELDYNGNGETVVSNPFYTATGTQFGAQTEKYTDLHVTDDYQIFREDDEANMEVIIPNIPGLKLHMGARREVRKGWKQEVVMTGKCSPCHMVGTTKRIDEETTDFKAGVSWSGGPVSITYYHMIREFDVEADDPTQFFEVAAAGGSPSAVRAGRLNYDAFNGEIMPYAVTPESEKDMDVIKARIDLPCNTNIFGSWTSSEIDNEYNDTQLEQDVYAGRITGTYLDNMLTVSLKYRYLELDNDDVNIVINEGFAATDGLYLAAPDFDWTRESVYDRDSDMFSVDAVFRLNRMFTFNGGYEYRSEDRDDYVVGDGGETETEADIFKFGIKFRPMSNLKLRAQYEHQEVDDPFAAYHTMCQIYRDGISGSVAYYEIFRNAYRQGSGAVDPEDSDKITAYLTWNVLPNLSLSLNGSWLDEENDENEVEWENEVYTVGANVWFSPMERLSLNAGFNYQDRQTETRVCVDLFGG